MDVRNCKMCGKLFNYMNGRPICAGCKAKLEEKFQEVKEYIRNNPKASLTEISEDNDVSAAQIKQWIREERLIFTEDSMVGLECEKCGGMIRTGRFCEKCKANMSNDLSNAYRKEEPKPELKKPETSSSAKMRYLDR